MTTEMSSLLQVAKARQLIQMESSQPITLDERLGKVPKPDSNFGNKNQFESWDFPKPSQQMEGNSGNLFRTDCVIMIHTLCIQCCPFMMQCFIKGQFYIGTI